MPKASFRFTRNDSSAARIEYTGLKLFEGNTLSPTSSSAPGTKKVCIREVVLLLKHCREYVRRARAGRFMPACSVHPYDSIAVSIAVAMTYLVPRSFRTGEGAAPGSSPLGNTAVHWKEM